MRIGICADKKIEIMQSWDGKEWVCLHDETRSDELKAIKIYKIYRKSIGMPKMRRI